MKKTFLITGLAGYIGSYLCNYFFLKNYKVISIDKLTSFNLNNLSDIKKEFNQKREELTHRGKLMLTYKL